jgi:hypothetical protein
MEPRPFPQSYLIFCEKHMPLKLKRALQNRISCFIDEIQQFCRSIEKNHQNIAQQLSRTSFIPDKKRRLELRA